MSASRQGMSHGKDRKRRGRTSITGVGGSTTPNVPQTLLTEVNRSVTANGNGNKHRGDRRDMSKAYTGNQRHATRGNTARPDVETRAR